MLNDTWNHRLVGLKQMHVTILVFKMCVQFWKIEEKQHRKMWENTKTDGKCKY